MPRGTKYDFFERMALDVPTYYDCFTGDAINLDYWAVAKNGTSAVDFAVPSTLISGGAIRAETGTDDNGYADIIGPKIYDTAKNCLIIVKFKLDAVTTVKFEVGFADAHQAGMVNALDTPTSTGTDYAVMAFDTDSTDDKIELITDGTTGAAAATATTLAPAADTYHTAAVHLQNGNSAGYWDGQLVAQSTQSPDAATLVCPWIFVQTRAGSANRIMYVDYVFVMQDPA